MSHFAAAEEDPEDSLPWVALLCQPTVDGQSGDENEDEGPNNCLNPLPGPGKEEDPSGDQGA